MYKFLTKYGQLLGFGLGALIVVIFVASAVGGMAQYGEAPAREVLYESTIFDFGLVAARWMAIIALILMIVFIVRSIFMNPKGSIPLVIAAIAIIVLFFIFKGSASEEVTAAMRKYSVSVNQGKIVSGSIWVATIMTLGAWAALILSEIRGIFK